MIDIYGYCIHLLIFKYIFNYVKYISIATMNSDLLPLKPAKPEYLISFNVSRIFSRFNHINGPFLETTM